MSNQVSQGDSSGAPFCTKTGAPCLLPSYGPTPSPTFSAQSPTVCPTFCTPKATLSCLHYSTMHASLPINILIKCPNFVLEWMYLNHILTPITHIVLKVHTTPNIPLQTL